MQAESPDAAAELLRVAADVLQNGRADEAQHLTLQKASSMWDLLIASTGHRDDRTVDVGTRQRLLDAAMRVLDPAITAYAESDPGDDGRAWLADNVHAPLQRLRNDLSYLSAKDRVERSFLVDGKQVIDPDDSSKPHDQAALLHSAMPKLVVTTRGVNELVVKMHEARLDHEVEEQIAGHFHGHVRFGSLLEVANALAVLDSMLVLTDEELAKRLDAGTVFGKIGTIAELVKASVEVAGGAVGVTASTIEIIAKFAGEKEVAELAGGLARGVAIKIGTIVTVVDGLRALFVAADSSATKEQRLDGGVDLVSDALWIAYQLRETASLGAASFAVRAGYYAAKFALEMNWESAAGIETGIMRPAFESLSRHGMTIASCADQVRKARELAEHEVSSDQRSLLYKVLLNESRQLGEAIDSLIADMQPPALGADMLGKIGGSRALVQALAPVDAYKGARSPADTLLATDVALERIKWSLEHALAIVTAETKGEGVDAVTSKPDIGAQEHGE